jgi:hypothetical protein
MFLSLGSNVAEIRIHSYQWIRIRNPDPDPEGQKLATKIEKSYEISCFEVLDVLF